MSSKKRKQLTRTCIHCDEELTSVEVRHYGHACDDCERKETRRVHAWRHGAHDSELDARYSLPRPMLH